jgi:stage II sporulation protein GA (sporulation sigma-E factor processing peptidase)
MGGAVLLLGGLCVWELRSCHSYIPVMLSWGQYQENILALRDTGNTLRDPVSGEPVLVAGPSVAENMLGLSKEELSTPAETMVSSNIKGLRLIPYRTVGQRDGLLLAIRIPCAKVGLRKGSVMVAFSPTVLDPDGRYHALAGGKL